jgi:UDP-GlcNAc:undecaprenyl-phosphate GlcNAc-1-phosphate transferase
MVGGLAGFLRFNFPPARIYLGDGGAYFLGFLIGIMTIVSSQKGTVVAAMMAPLFVLALPILDTTLAIVRRGVQGLPLFRPDRRHIHHRLIETGVPQRNIVLGVYAFTAVFLGLGFIAFWSKGMWIPNLLGLGLLMVLLLAGRLNFSREWFAVGRVLGNSLDMRQEVQFAISLTNWIVLSSTRAASLDDLWEDFVFAARKLGFSYARIQLEGGDRLWERSGTAGNPKITRREMLRSQFGTLELGALLLESEDSLPGSANPEPAVAFAANIPVVSERVFEMTGELLAEGWIKAARRWAKARQLPPRFSAASEDGEVLPLKSASAPGEGKR